MERLDCLMPRGARIFTLTSGENNWGVELEPSMTLQQLRLYINAKMTTGLVFNDAVDMLAAKALFSAAEHPQFRYVELAAFPPLWWERLKEQIDG